MTRANRPAEYNGTTRMSDKDIEKMAERHPRKAALLRACKAVGGAVQLAKLLPASDDRRRRGISHQIVYHWIRAGGCPDSRVVDISEVSGVSVRDLRGEA